MYDLSSVGLPNNKWSQSAEWVVTMFRNGWSQCSGMSGQFAAEWVVTIQRNTHQSLKAIWYSDLLAEAAYLDKYFTCSIFWKSVS